jgi:hypothetical protein
MAIAHAQVVLPAHSGVARDAIVNTWTFVGTGTAVDVAAAADPLIQAFYLGTGGDGIANQMTAAIDGSSAVTKWYKLSDTSNTTPDALVGGAGRGSPILVTPMPYLAGVLGGDPLPSQIAIAMSYHGVHFGLAEHSGAGPRPAQRLRGRIYFSPLAKTCSTPDSATHAAIVTTGVVSGLVHQATVLMAAGAGLAAEWSLWSRKNNTCYTVVGGFVDNRFDTQRRRAELSTARGTFGSP